MLRLRASAAAVSRASSRALRILAADPVDASCGETFNDNGHKLTEKKMKEPELLLAIPAYEGLVVRSGVKVTADIIAAGKKLRIIGRAGAGVDNIDCAAATRAGVLVMNTPGGNTSAAAELTLSLLMNMARSIPAACATLKVRRRASSAARAWNATQRDATRRCNTAQRNARNATQRNANAAQRAHLIPFFPRAPLLPASRRTGSGSARPSLRARS
jgi:lactate dehydrogenase-like 2-hydroxyacid dehydrogenase